MAVNPDVKNKVLNTTRPGIGAEEVLDIYKSWAKAYDKDHAGGNYPGPRMVAEVLAGNLGDRRGVRILDVGAGTGLCGQEDLGEEEYGGPRKVAEVLAASLGPRRDVRVLDVAAGTGLCGLELSKLGFTNLDALDASQDMLDVAKTKNVYKNFLKDFLGPNRLHIEDDTYDAVTGCGLFCSGHVKSDCLEQLIRVVKPGGLVCIGIRETLLRDACKDLEPRMTALQSEGLWERVSKEIFPGYCVGFEGAVFVYKVL